ncbi:hypothetical protein Q1695_005572 [Nippostrongylus brasiliensis]|nr:hypothetical protein Q1695_005572 [Nippostrongylus brasiliensis]
MPSSAANHDLTVAILTKNQAAVNSLLAGDDIDLNHTDTTGSLPLHYAAFTGDTTLIKLFLERSADINARNSLGLTALHRAVAAHRYDAAQLLIDQGCDTTSRCKLFQTALHTCAIHNVPNVAALLLRDRYAALDYADGRGCTALHHAAYHGHVEVAEQLLKAGINMAAVDKMGRTAVHSMACGGSLGMLAVLRQAGASFSVRDNCRRTAAHYAAMASQTEILAELIKLDANCVNEIDDGGYTPLHYAVQNGHNAKTVELLVENGSDVAAASNNGTTALHIAASLAESPKPIEYLINCQGIDLNTKNADGMTPLHLASEWSKVSRVDALIRAGAEVDARSKDNATPLHCAAIGGHQLVVKHLLKAGADSNARMRGDFTPLHLAAYNASRPVVQTLVEMGADLEAQDHVLRTPLFLAAESISDNGAFTAEYLVQNNAEVNVVDKNGYSPLHFAAARGLDQVVNVLIDGGADVFKKDKQGRNALHFAALSGSECCVKKICKADSRIVYERDENGFYPLHYAAYAGAEHISLELFDYMKYIKEMPTCDRKRFITPFHMAAINNKAKPSVRLAKAIEERIEKAKLKRTNVERPRFAYADVRRRIPLHYAMKYGHLESSAVLLSQEGAPLCLTWRDDRDLTPLHFAAANGKTECIEYVLRKFSNISVIRKDSCGRTCGMLSLTSLKPSWPLIMKSNLNRCDIFGRGYLHRAVYSHDQGVVAKLLETCDPNIRDNNGVTPLHVAAAVDDAIIADMLIDSGAKKLATDNYGFTPVDYAAAHDSSGVIQRILDRLAFSSGPSSTDSALGTGSTTSKNTSGDAASDDSKLTISPSDDAPCGHAGLLFASHLGNINCVIELLERYPRIISTRDPQGRTPLHLAAWKDQYHCVKYLLEKGIDVEAVDDYGVTPLMYAVREPSSLTTLGYLLKHGANVSKKDHRNNTVLHHCCMYGNQEAGKALVNYLAKYDPEREICNAVNVNGETALHFAMKNRMLDFVLSFPFGVDSMFIKDVNGRVPLFNAVDDPDMYYLMKYVLWSMAEERPLEIAQLLGDDLHQSAL